MNIGRVAYATIPESTGTSSLKYASGYTADIMREVFDCYNENKDQLQDFAPNLRQATLLETCRAIWQFVHSNIHYEVDPPFKQWVKTPARLWADRSGDCKSFSVFIASCLYNLGINGMFRFVSFNGSELPTHVYVVVPDKNGTEIIIDAVLPWFNKQKQYTYKHDYNMTEISRLSGLPQTVTRQRSTVDNNRPFAVMGVNNDQPTIAGFFDGLFGVNKKHVDLWTANLPATCGAYLYIFIPDALVPSMPPAVQAKRNKQIQSLQFVDDKADKAYSYDQAVNDVHMAIRATYGAEPLDLINTAFGARIGIIPVLIAAGVALVGAMKNIIGKYGTYGFDFPAGLNPGDVAPAQSDWTAYTGMNSMATPTDPQSGLPTGSNGLPLPTSSGFNMSSLLMWGGIGLGAYFLLRKKK